MERTCDWCEKEANYIFDIVQHERIAACEEHKLIGANRQSMSMWMHDFRERSRVLFSEKPIYHFTSNP